MMNQTCRLAVIGALLSIVFFADPRTRANTPPVAGTQIPLSRQAFAARMRGLKPGMTEAQVEARLGKPDFVGHFDDKSFPVSWFYGCTGPHKIPLLGSVWFDDKNLSAYPFAGDWPPPPASVISEPELRAAMLHLDQVPADDPVDPGATIRVVNGLLPFGKAKVLAAIREYVRVVNDDRRPDQSIEWQQARPATPGSRETMYKAGKLSGIGSRNRIVFLLRALFDFPSKPSALCGETLPIPIPMIGEFMPIPPLDQVLAPRFPVVIIDDVPLLELLVIQQPRLQDLLTDILPLFEQRGHLRTRPLRPTDHPEMILSHLKSSPKWFFGKRYRVRREYYDGYLASGFYDFSPGLEKEMQKLVETQILELLAPLYPKAVRFEPPFDSSDRWFGIDADLSQWDFVMADLKVHPVRWNPKTEEYERVRSDPKAPPPTSD